MATSTYKVFLGCNYSNQKVKAHFNMLKEKLEKDWPVHVCIIDKEPGKGARDLWSEIRRGIDECALAVFDVSGFRPNVVLELGYSLAVKDEEVILICFDERKPRKGGKPSWLLSDVGHLNQTDIVNWANLIKRLNRMLLKCQSSTDSSNSTRP
ncbi:MAG: hypothetical protein ABTD50_16410 [Polyangiaceae bacterium]|jgi:hypothetical protein